MSLLKELNILNDESDQGRVRALTLVEGMSAASLNKAQRTLRRRVLHQLNTFGITQNDRSRRDWAAANYDSIRAALSLLDRLERAGELDKQQKAATSDATSALHAAEDAAARAVRLA